MSGIEQPLEEVCPYIYETAVSPHLAAKIEGNPVEMECVLKNFDHICGKYDYVTAEGSIGILCPLRFDEQEIRLEDFIKARSLACLIIADAGLGTINAVVLTAEYMKTMKSPYKIVHAEGVYLYTEDQKLIDSVSSWWGVIHSYKHPELNQAIEIQLKRFAHVMLGGLTHESAQKLSDKLQSWLPGDLDYCFFSDSGSVAVEVALKIALQYYMNRQETQRTMVLALEHAYHGDTFKTMEVGDDEDYHFVLKAYGKSKYIVHIPTKVEALEQAFAEYHDRLNSFIVESLLQGAGGMRM